MAQSVSAAHAVRCDEVTGADGNQRRDSGFVAGRAQRARHFVR
jgi:hypothetical protein